MKYELDAWYYGIAEEDYFLVTMMTKNKQKLYWLADDNEIEYCDLVEQDFSDRKLGQAKLINILYGV